MTIKQLALDVATRLPSNATMHDLAESLYAAAVSEGLLELDRGEGIRHDSIKIEFETWFAR